MSFRVDLWNGVNLVKTQITSTFEKMSNFYNILLSYSNFQKAHCKNLETLYKENKDKFKDDYLLDKSLLLFVENFKLESECLQKSYEFIQEEVLSSFKETLENEKTLFNDIINDGIQISENYELIKNNLIINQKNYHNSLKEFNDFILSVDDNELQSILYDEVNASQSVYSKEMDRSLKLERDKNIKENKNRPQILKKMKLIEKIKENKKEYMSSLKESNEFLYIYRDKYENILQSLEDKYKLLLNNIHLTLTTTIGHKINLNNEINIIYNSYMENNLNNINIDEEIMEFIIKNATKEFPRNKFEFIPVKIDNKKLDINKYLNDLSNPQKEMRRGKSHKNEEQRAYNERAIKKKKTCIYKDINIMEVTPFKKVNEFKLKTNIILIGDYIEDLITDDEENICFDEETMNLDKMKTFLDRNNAEHLMYLENIFKVFNKNRAKGNFLINKVSYDIFIGLFNLILNNFSNLDYILKNAIILSQTFYIFEKNNENSNSDDNKTKTKIFIQNGLKNNPIFNNPEIWHRVINYTLSTHVTNKDLTQLVDKNEVNKKLNAIAFNILASYLCDIKYFTDDTNVFDKIKNYYIKVYNLNEDLINKEMDSK
jgi:hypothetical protein